jgi:methyl-accepting chemotaxis protein
VNAAPSPVDPPSGPQGPRSPQGVPPSISAAADRARAELHAEIERVRVGVEEVLAEQSGPVDANLQRELADLREDTRLYVKKRLRKTEKKLERSVGKVADSVEEVTDSVANLDQRTQRLEARIDQVEADRAAAEHRIHSDTERMLDGLLREVRDIADMLTGGAQEGAGMGGPGGGGTAPST